MLQYICPNVYSTGSVSAINLIFKHEAISNLYNIFKALKLLLSVAKQKGIISILQTHHFLRITSELNPSNNPLEVARPSILVKALAANIKSKGDKGSPYLKPLLRHNHPPKRTINHNLRLASTQTSSNSRDPFAAKAFSS